MDHMATPFRNPQNRFEPQGKCSNLFRPVGLFALGGWHTGIVRRLRWHTKLRFKLRHTRRQYLHLRGQRLNLRPQRQDQGIFLVVRQATEVGELGHPKLESWPPWSRQPFIDSAIRALSDRGG
jgi:hypothetical protein